MKTIFFTLVFSALLVIGTAVVKYGLASKPEAVGAADSIESVGLPVGGCTAEKKCDPALSAPVAKPQTKPSVSVKHDGVEGDSHKTVEPWVRQMHDLMREGRTDAAIALLTEALELDPKNERGLLGLARLYSHYKNDPAKAEGLFRKALEVNPNNGAVLDELLFLYESPERSGSKAAAIKELADKFPRSPSVAEAYGRSLVESGGAAEAVSYLRSAAENSPHPERALRSLAEAYGLMNDFQHVAETYATLVSFQEKQLLDAQKKGFDTSDLEQAMVSNQIQLASALFANKQKDRAESLIHSVLQRAPGNSEAESLLARLRGG